MQLTYKTDYPNEVHQLAVSVSKHLIILRNGLIKFQQKPIDVGLATLANSPKDHVVHYLIRDHCSGVFYAEVCCSKRLMSLEDFLFRAWSEKAEYEFCGAPECISIPKVVSNYFPRVNELIADYGIQTIEVTSGFQSGAIRDVKTWEHHIRAEINSEEGIKLLSEWTPSVTAEMSAELNGKYSSRSSKIERWKYGITRVRIPPADGWYAGEG